MSDKTTEDVCLACLMPDRPFPMMNLPDWRWAICKAGDCPQRKNINMPSDVPETTNFPDAPKPDRLMSSVMSMAQKAVSRVENYRSGVEQMMAYEDAGGDGWWRGWEMLKAAYREEIDDRS